MRAISLLHRLRIVSALGAASVALVAAGAASAIIVESDEALFDWAEAPGPVAGYNVYVTRNGSPSPTPIAVSSSLVSVPGSIGDRVVVQVAAFDKYGDVGPVSPASEEVTFAAPPPPAPPPQVIVESVEDFSIDAARSVAASGEQVIAQLRGDDKLLLDTAPPEDFDAGNGPWGLDQLIVGAPGQPTTVRLVDVLGLEELGSPLTDLPVVTLGGLGNGTACDRDGEPGLVIHPGSKLVLGGAELHAFDGESCVLLNEGFGHGKDPNAVDWGDGQVLLHGDLEGDGVIDPDDNCLLVANVDQCDGDRDGFGNRCDYDVNQDGGVSLDDVQLTMSAAEDVSEDPVYDHDCDGAATLVDVGLVLRQQTVAPAVGPSGLACAADASCATP